MTEIGHVLTSGGDKGAATKRMSINILTIRSSGILANTATIELLGALYVFIKRGILSSSFAALDTVVAKALG